MAFLIVKYRKMREGEKKTLRHFRQRGTPVNQIKRGKKSIEVVHTSFQTILSVLHFVCCQFIHSISLFFLCIQCKNGYYKLCIQSNYMYKSAKHVHSVWLMHFCIIATDLNSSR